VLSFSFNSKNDSKPTEFTISYLIF
jgi:hypothetical protein